MSILPWEELQRQLQQMAGDWDILEFDITSPPKEVAPMEGVRQFRPGDHMRIIIHLKKNEREG